MAANTEQKAAWNAKTYKRYQVYLRKTEDQSLIDWIESQKKTTGTSELFREALEEKKSKG